MVIHTRSQKLARAAYERVAQKKLTKEYVSFAKRFPALIHTCGLAQAVAFASAKDPCQYGDDLSAVLKACGHDTIDGFSDLDEKARSAELTHYIRLSRDALNAASWIKRYVEAAVEEA